MKPWVGRVGRWALATGLAAAAGVGAHGFVHRDKAVSRAADAESPPASATGGRAADPAQSPGASPSILRSDAIGAGAIASCARELDRCRAATSWLFATLTGNEPRGADAEAPVPAPAALVAAETGAEVQQDVLSHIAREHLRRHWHNERDRIVANLRQTLGDPAKQDRDTLQNVSQFSRALALSEAERADLHRAYAPARARRIAQAHAVLAGDPPDFARLLATAKGLFGDEDDLVAARFGAEARARLRSAQIESRTTILAIVGAWAGVPWDQSIAW